MTEITTAAKNKAISTENEKTELTNTKRLSKPLPLKPSPTMPFRKDMDLSSYTHFSKLLETWLIESQIPSKPWFQLLLDIMVDLYENSLNTTTTNTTSGTSNTTNKGIWLQTLPSNTPTESKFLTNVFHGTVIQPDELLVEFPISGTIRLYGLKDETLLTKMKTLIESLVYLTYSLYLENFIMLDSHVKLITSQPLRQPEPEQEQEQEDTTNLPQEPILVTLDENPLTRKFSYGISGWIKKFSSTLNYHSDPVSKIKNRSDPLNTVAEETGRGLPLNNVSNLHEEHEKSQKESHQNRNELKTEEGNSLKFLNTKENFKNNLITTSPDCHFPYPTLINRLEVEEEAMIKQKESMHHNELNKTDVFDDSKRESLDPQDRRASLKSKLGIPTSWRNDHTESNSKTQPIMDTPLPQSFTAYSSVRIPSFLVDTREGLNHLITDTKSLSRFKKHQRITFSFMCYPAGLTGCPDRPCLGPIMSTIDYFRFKQPKSFPEHKLFSSMDQNLGQTIKQWCNRSNTCCQTHVEGQLQFVPDLKVSEMPNLVQQTRPALEKHASSASKQSDSLPTPTEGIKKRQCDKFHGCPLSLIDHVYSFAHGVGRINVIASKDDSFNSSDEDSKENITTWISCSACNESMPSNVMKEEAASFSFAKYLELMFYSKKMSNPEPFCEHTASHNGDIRSRITRCFRYHGTVLKFTYEDAKYYDLRTPKIQIADVSNVKDFSLSSPRISAVVLNEWKQNNDTDDVNQFFVKVCVHLGVLSNHFEAERKRKRKIQAAKGDSAAIKRHQQEMIILEQEMTILEKDIKELSKRLDKDNQTLLKILEDTGLNELNDFRRIFEIQSMSIIKYLSEWQEQKCNEIKEEFIWDSPNYISSESVHCFPGSSVLVREDEPTSIIAYTLSSTDYIQELLLEDAVDHTENSHSKNSSVPSLTLTSTTKNSSKASKEPVIVASASTSTEEKHKRSSHHSSHKKTKEKSEPSMHSHDRNVIDGYYSSIERKYVSPSTGASSETASFRAMVIEVAKSNLPDMSKSKRLSDIIPPWTKRQEEEKKAEGWSLESKSTERTLNPLVTIQGVEPTKEVKVASYMVEQPITPQQDQQQSSHDGKKNVSSHIEHKFTHRNTEFTCIVYFAKEFEILRRRCDINQLIIESLSRCQSWGATGGKSKSHFYKTQDDRLVVKEMVSAWNIAEKDAFLKFAPKYFEYMKKSAKEPSILAKIFGFFTIQMKSTTDKKSILNMDVLVMEHLFYDQTVIKRFDFKGLQDRHVEESRKQQPDATLWDGDWLDEYRTKQLVHEQSNAIMKLGVKNDTEFLAKCNIMDYSLLVGIDKEKHELRVGIVDFIGAYTWYKRLESRSKSTLRPAKEVTVLPPEQYKDRFNREICDYFIPVPGKFDLVEQEDTLPSLLIYVDYDGLFEV